MLLSKADLGNLDPRGVLNGFIEAGQPGKVTGAGIDFLPRPNQHFLHVTKVADQASIGNALPTLVAIRDAFDKQEHKISRSDVFAVRIQAQRLLRERQFLRFSDLIMEAAWGEMANRLINAMMPVFFEAYPRGSVFLINASKPLHLHYTNLAVLQRVSVLQNVDERLMRKYAGRPRSMGALGISTPLQFLFPALEVGLNTFFNDRYGFVAPAQMTYLFVFLFGEAQTVRQPAETEIDEISWSTLSVMDSRFGGLRLEPKRTYTFSRRRYSGPEFEAWFVAYVLLLDSSLLWISDLTRFSKQIAAKNKTVKVIDLDFAIQSFLTLYMVFVLTLKLLVSHDAYGRKTMLFDLLDLHASLVTIKNRQSQTRAWRRMASSAFSKTVVARNLGKLPQPIAADLQVQLQTLRDRGLEAVEKGIVYPDLMNKGCIPLRRAPGGACSVEDFEPQLLRELRNTKHGYAVFNYEVLKRHTGAIDNDFPDYSLALLLNLLIDKSEYRLTGRRSDPP